MKQFYVTDGDKIDGGFFNTEFAANECAQALSKEYTGKRINVYRLITEASYYEQVDPKLDLIEKCRKLLMNGCVKNAGQIDSNLLELKHLIKEGK